MGSRNGSNVRTMRTRFPRGRKDGEQQQENRLRLSLGVRSQGAWCTVPGGRKVGSRNGSNVRTMRTKFPGGRVMGPLLPTEWFRGGQHSRWREAESAALVVCREPKAGWASSSSVRRSLSARAGSLGGVMPVSTMVRVSIMIRHTDDCSSPVSIEKERFQGGTKPPSVLCLHASRPRSWVRPTRARGDRVRLHDSALP